MMAKLVSYAEIVDALGGAWDTASIQALGFDGAGEPLVCDGVAGPRTLGGRYLLPSEQSLDEGTLLGQMLRFVREGRQEDEGVNNGGKDVLYMWYGDGPAPLQRPGAWCAATVSRAIINSKAIANFVFNPGARRLTNDLAARKAQVPLERISVGDIISWAVPRPKAPYGGHIGVVVGVLGGKVYVVEGNGAARRGRVRVYAYDLPLVRYGKDKQYAVWRVVRPEAVR